LGGRLVFRYPFRVTTLFRRKSADVVTVETEPVATATHPVGKAYTAKKGSATPKRGSAKRVEAPPTTRREAIKKMRAKAKAERMEARAGMAAGKQQYLLKRDKGDDRVLIRDIVDSRRNLGTWFFGAAFVVIAASFSGAPAVIAMANLFWIFAMIAIVIDFVLLSLRIRKIVGQRISKPEHKPMANYAYACMRSLSFRKIRMPAPRVKVGEAI
jgi:hypothetical protein